MDAMQLIRALGALSAVLALLGGALWAVRRYDLALPGRIGGRRASRLGLLERISLDNKRSIALIRHAEKEHLLLIAPEGNIVLDGGEGAGEERAPLVIDLAHCRALGSAVPLPPAPCAPLWPGAPVIPGRPRRPRHDPLPATRQ